MNIRAAVREIHAKAERAAAGPDATLRGSPAVQTELAILHGAYERLYQMRGLVGQMPPAPDTLRARIGAHLVRMVQRMLFWYTPQIHRVQNEVTNTIGSLSKLVEMQAQAIEALSKQVRAAQLSPQMTPARAAPDSEETSSLPPAFEFALQEQFRGSERETTAKLERWLRSILRNGGNSGAEWLDIGCGRGEWLDLAARGGYPVCGVDAIPAAVNYCRERGLRAEAIGAVEFLHGRPDESLGVVTMFHVVEHLPPEGLPALLALIARKLRAGGLIAIETPNPGNLLMGAHHFWNDPTHRRPLPEALLRFMLEYSGFGVIEASGLNPFPAENHLPWQELDVVRQVDHLLYDARDYGVLARK